MNVPIQKIEFNKGKPVIVVDGHKFRQAFLKKSGEISWHCTVKDCAEKVTTDASCQAVLNESLWHIHEINPRNVRFYELREKEKLQTKFQKDRQRSFHHVCYLQLENFTKLT